MSAFDRVIKGIGTLRRGDTILSQIAYTIYFTQPFGPHAAVVEFDAKPAGTKDGDQVDLTLEDGRILTCQVLDESPYCAVQGDGPIVERRVRLRT